VAFTVEKSSTKNWATSVIFESLHIVSNSPLGEKSPIGQKIAQNMQPNPFIPGFYSRKIWRKIAHSPMFANKHRGTAHRTDYQMLQNEPFVQNTFSALKNVHKSKVCQEADIFFA
jgi:hypothetical protein